MSLRPLTVAAALACAGLSPALATGPLQVTSRVLVERRVAAGDGTTRVVTVARRRAAPGDGLLVELSYHNAGARPITDLVLADPVPAAMAYRAPAPGSPVPEVSVDGVRFAPIAALVVPLTAGGVRPASEADVVAVRWRFAGALTPGASGTLAYRAVLK